MKRTVQIISFAIGAAVLSGCATLPETTRSAVSVQVPQASSITALQRKFQADAPYIVNFGFDDASLDEEALARLDRQATWILAHPNVKFRVHGHTDRVGNIAYNQELGMCRATGAVNYLIGNGIAPERLEAVVSFGEELPMVDTEERERRNRRTVTEVYEYITLPPSTTVPKSGLLATVFTPGESLPAPNSVGDTPDQTPSSDPTPTSDPTPSSGPSPSEGGETPSTKTKSNNSQSKNHNAGRGNGDETGDPGNSEEKNNGGDI